MKNKPYPLYPMADAETLNDIISRIADQYGEAPAFRIPQKRRQPDTYKSFITFRDEINAFGTYLAQENFLGEKVAILGENCYDWVVSYFGVTNSGNVAVPLDRALTAEELAQLINRCQCKGVVCSKTYEDYAELFKTLCPQVTHFFVMQDVTTYRAEAQDASPKYAAARPSGDSLAAIVFTSGTTGVSKGAMLTHRNIASDATSICRNTCAAGRALLILPLHHTFSLTVNILCALLYGICVYAVTSLRNIQGNMQEDHTTTLFAVPAVLETMDRKVWSAAEEAGKTEKMKKAMVLARLLLKCGIDVRKKLFKDVHEAFGGALETVICGGAALDARVEENFHLWGFNMIGGYGITECSPVACVNRNQYKKLHCAGLPMDCCTFRIANADEKGIGEIQIKGSNVFAGYLADEAETAKAFTPDGWFATGDLGYIDKDGFVFITGRIKNLIILSNGKNVSPEELENKLLAEIPEIGEIVVYGENDALTAEIYPEENLTDGEAIIRKAVLDFNRHMPAYKKIANIKMREEPFPKTTTLKIKRRQQKG